jgi:hypothetical protein
MFKNIEALAAITLFLFGIGCSGSTPVVPDKGSQGSPEEYFNQFDLSSPVVAEYTYTDDAGTVLASGKLGRNDDGLYVIENRGGQFDLDFSPLNLVNCWVIYNNPRGTIDSGPNAGLPYYYLGDTVDYSILMLNRTHNTIGGTNWPAQVTAEMRYAEFDEYGVIEEGDLLPGEPTYVWSGQIGSGYSSLNDLFTIVPGTQAGLDVTCVEVEAPIFFGMLNIIFFDDIAGVWDPVE